VTAVPSAAPAAFPVVGAAPAGLTEAQLLVLKRLQAARAEMAALSPLDPDEVFAERYYERWKEES